jgi:ActR/RegA family two-component response regulator
MVPSVDVTAGNALRNLARALKQRGIAVEIAELRDDVFENLSAINAQLDLDHLATHKTIEDCISK